MDTSGPNGDNQDVLVDLRDHPRFQRNTSNDTLVSSVDVSHQRHLPRVNSAPATVNKVNHDDNSTSNGGPPTFGRSISAIVSPGKNNVKTKNGSMVLHLVLPNHSHTNNNNYMSHSSIDEILENSTAHKRRSISSQDLYSAAGTEIYSNHAFNTDLSEYGPNFVRESARTPVSLSSSSDQAKSTSSEDKKRNFRKHLTNILSSMYALFIVTLSLVVYISDMVMGSSPMAEIFSLYLVIVAYAFVLYLTIDIKLFVNKKNRYNELLEKSEAHEIELKESPAGDYQLNITLPEAAKIVKQLDHHYCFSKDRHSGNFYLKIGAAGFCIGHLIHSGLLLGYQILFLTSDTEAFLECATIVGLVLDIAYPLYSFFLLYFIFKYSNIIINRNVAAVRFGLMHSISSSICFWIWTILRETIESISHHDDDDHNDYDDDYDAQEDAGISEVAFFSGQPAALPLVSYDRKGAKLLTNYLNASVRQFVGVCQSDPGLSMIYRNYSPYLYPFTVEYSILVVGVLVVIWQKIGKCKETEEMSRRQCDSVLGNSDNLESNMVLHADCHSANKGLFGGLIIMVLTVVSIILFLIAFNDEKFHDNALIINAATSMVILILMSVSGVLAYRQITRLDVSQGHHSVLDDLLLFICIPAFFLNGIVTIVPAVVVGNGNGITVILLEVSQVLIQTPLIIDGLRRCSNSKELRKEKPGRELLSFLIVANVSMWVMQTFEVQSHGLQDERNEFYGEELWTIIGHLCIPLMMFYRFHSSVCLGDVWKHAYERNEH